MRICVIQSSVRGERTSVSYVMNFRNVEVYIAKIKMCNSRRALQKRCVRMLRECKKLKIALFSMSSSDAMYEYLLGVGMNIVDENRFFESRIAEMAIQFSRETVSYVEFFILGGDAKTVADIGVQLLAVCRNVYADGAAFEAASELVLETAGVPLRRRSSSPCVEIEIYPERIMFRYGEKTAVPSDFDVIGVPPEIEKYFGENNLALVSLLEICGVFGRNEIKTAYLGK